jgi:hypothetical protein
VFFQRYIEPLLAPFRAVQNKIVQARTIKGNIKVDIGRIKGLGTSSKDMLKDANSKINQYSGGQSMQQPGSSGQAGGAQPQNGQQNGSQTADAQGANGLPPIRKQGFWIFKKTFCNKCNQMLDNTWDHCPFCAQAQASSAPKAAPLKTQAFVLDSQGAPGSMRLLGWIVPLSGPQRGELITLSPSSVVGTEPSCTVMLTDQFMSQKHAEIKAEGGIWVLKDLGSTNGTYVNNRRVEKHELVDNDFIKFGSAMVKFKSL